MSDLTNKLAMIQQKLKGAKVAGKHVLQLTNIDLARTF
jgi:hypothetical protein